MASAIRYSASSWSRFRWRCDMLELSSLSGFSSLPFVLCLFLPFSLFNGAMERRDASCVREDLALAWLFGLE